ncbi:hypothetical protein niasHS_002752 [Heterodera schachtii]|uniref:Galectin n=2 Tax=Heterodera TaxID=34509 RepID=A0ABD2K2C1_HETSC
MFPPSPSIAECPSPSTSFAKMPSSSALTAAPNQSLLSSQMVEIRCFCHFDLLGAQFSITHDDQTNDFFVDLLPSGDSSPILSVLFRFVDCQSADGGEAFLQIFASSYGHWRPSGSVHHFSLGEGPMRLHVHVHQQFYALQMNGTEVEAVIHKRPFSQILVWTKIGEEKETETDRDDERKH